MPGRSARRAKAVGLRFGPERNAQAATMRSAIGSRGRAAIPAEIRNRFNLGPADRLEWLVENGEMRASPIRWEPVAAFRGRGKGGATARPIADRQADREAESAVTCWITRRS
jgi:AbrB family looped-hinge helix DNA binding protein